MASDIDMQVSWLRFCTLAVIQLKTPCLMLCNLLLGTTVTRSVYIVMFRAMETRHRTEATVTNLLDVTQDPGAWMDSLHAGVNVVISSDAQVASVLLMGSILKR